MNKGTEDRGELRASIIFLTHSEISVNHAITDWKLSPKSIFLLNVCLEEVQDASGPFPCYLTFVSFEIDSKIV